ncbi:MAG TPA: L,D-transpeptidase [Nocardioides sp.]|uniref:L,D-transpeptidase n=1 Tax=Nocardioides sp. TaxID=35761 RepID=UPI002E340397|nr:L,D-transpeptidase [Nocardioides sp.]HEX3929115.1 L,D-transpeptidase [Nocardioides sp.]
MSTHRREVRPRYGRIAALAASVTVSAVAALAGFGLLSGGSAQAGAGPRAASFTGVGSPSQSPDVPAGVGGGQGKASPSTHRHSADAPSGDASSSAGSDPGGSQLTGSPPASTSSDSTTASSVPVSSGSGRRIVFSQSSQRVWLVGASSDDVQRTYLVSGSLTHNLQPGTYSVYSKSRWAVGVDDSGVMQYFVRFTQGPTGAAIGFHSIPTKNGVPLQTRAQLGTPESHGCIRQYLPDAIALWDFAPIGTKVVVVA